jgi:hypothetical protein
MPHRKVAVLTDSLSAQFYFPVWYRYYSVQLGAENTHLMTLKGSEDLFSSYKLGSITGMDPTYDDEIRLGCISERVGQLLEIYDYVIRVDTDEILVLDPDLSLSLSQYIDTLRLDYVTARGFDVFQHSQDAPLQYEHPILVSQRQHAFALTAMNKTCITSKRLSWTRGFHYCSEMPRFDSVYLFHLKRADTDGLVDWNKLVASKIATDPVIKAYYETPADQVRAFQTELSRRITENGHNVLNRGAFNEQFFGSIKYNIHSGIYEGQFLLDTVNVGIPERFRGAV